jgi:hypothetical protein
MRIPAPNSSSFFRPPKMILGSLARTRSELVLEHLINERGSKWIADHVHAEEHSNPWRSLRV